MVERPAAQDEYPTLVEAGLLARSSRRAIYHGGLMVAALGVPFLIFLFSLDRYPLYYVDEPFFSEPAVRLLNGGDFLYRISANAPHGDVVFAAHSPVLSRLQLMVFRVLGVSQFSARLPDFVAGYLALMVLVAFLAGRRLWVTATALSLAWVGDRASQEVMLGRMDGLALLSLALGFVGLTRVIEVRSAGRAFWCGLGIGMACAFHPICIGFAVAGAVLLVFSRSSTPTDLRLTMQIRGNLMPLAWYTLGGTIPAALVLWLWTPHLAEALIQFRWSCQNELTHQISGRFARLLDLLGLCRFYFAGLVGLVGFVLLPMAACMILTRWRPGLTPWSRAPWVAALGFSLAGLVSLLRSMMFPYYLIYFTVWPVIALGLLSDGLVGDQRSLRRMVAVAGIALASCWVPGLFWNAMRAREAIVFREALDQAAFARRLASMVPADVPVTGTPELNLVARRAGLDFSPLTWVPEREPVRPRTWVILNRNDQVTGSRIEPDSLRGRPIVFDGPAFPGAKSLDYPITIFGPKPADPSRSPGG